MRFMNQQKQKDSKLEEAFDTAAMSDSFQWHIVNQSTNMGAHIEI